MSLGERIIELRSATSLSQGQLAERMGVSRQAVSKWENDLSTPDPLRLIQLADALDTDVEYLATGSHSKKIVKEPVVVYQTVEKPVYVDRIVEKPVYIDRIPEKTIEKVVRIPEEKIIERVVEKPVVKVKKVIRTRYRTNPFLLMIAGGIGFVFGVLIGFVL